ncbi:MAG: hypothetical protein M0P94_01670 [Candidatus Absconditabacterales bacterium]|nr:hypothetical protein [Candidatus Absconditabacterales bacterium]
MSKPNYAGQAVGGVTHIGLTPVQGGITVADAVGASVHTVLNTGKNLLKTLAYPFSTKTYKPQRNELGGIWKNFSNRQKDHRNKYIAPFKGNPNEAPLLAKATGGLTHFATAIPTTAVMTTLDASYSAVKTPRSILKNIGKSILYPFSTKSWKPKFKQDLKDIWGKEKGFAARTKNSWHEVFDVIPKKEK